MDILDILLDILLKPPQPLMGYFCIVWFCFSGIQVCMVHLVDASCRLVSVSALHYYPLKKLISAKCRFLGVKVKEMAVEKSVFFIFTNYTAL